MNDVVKTNVKRDQNSKRVRRRNRNKALYIFLVLILVLGIGVLLSVTLLFNIGKINIKGEVDYSDENIIMASGIEIGDNMVRLDADEAEKNILASMVYIENVDISKKYPDTLEITVEKCIPSANAEYDNGTLLLSPKGKILENNQEAQADLLTVKGLELITYQQGDYIRSADEQKTEIYFDIITALEGCKNSKVVSIDITDKYNIIINYDNRINFEAGNANKIAYKIKLADTVLEDISDDKKGTMVMIGENQISFRGESSASKEVNKSQRVPISEEDLPEGYTEPVTEATEENTEQEYYEEEYYEEEYSEEYSEGEYFEPEYYEDEYYEEYYEEEYYNEGYYEDEFYEEDY
ncbi:MAG: FtsQ-type POTRA domain-containing protein [Ruminococcus sp.]|nr:FtsQ-type POTRA domain-containing protein [Ruminococcus sp.]